MKRKKPCHEVRHHYCPDRRVSLMPNVGFSRGPEAAWVLSPGFFSDLDDSFMDFHAAPGLVGEVWDSRTG